MVILTTPKKLVQALRKLNLKQLSKNSAQIIADNIRELDGVGTHSPYTMSGVWNSLFEDVKTGSFKAKISDVTSSRWDPADAFYGDEDSYSQMTSSLLHSNIVKLSPTKFIRGKRFVIGRRGAFLVDDPHEIDYVLCHLKGYKKYEFGKKFNPKNMYVKARDVIISGTFLSVSEIIDLLKCNIRELIENED